MSRCPCRRAVATCMRLSVWSPRESQTPTVSRPKVGPSLSSALEPPDAPEPASQLFWGSILLLHMGRRGLNLIKAAPLADWVSFPAVLIAKPLLRRTCRFFSDPVAVTSTYGSFSCSQKDGQAELAEVAWLNFECQSGISCHCDIKKYQH